jgi:UDP-N-acetyl-D-galactosamine dehydrogenase
MTFKEDCPDLRNSRVIDVIAELHSYGVEVTVHDPMANSVDAQSEHGVALKDWADLPQADALIAAVAHRKFLELPLSHLLQRLKPGGCFIDVKSRFPADLIRSSGISLWRL